MSPRPHSLLGLVAVLVAAVLVATGCGPKIPVEPDHSAGTVPGSTTTTGGAGVSTQTAPPPTQPESGPVRYAAQGVLQLGLTGPPSNWNILARHPVTPAPDSALSVVAQAVWPSAFVVNRDGTVTRNTNLLTSATETSTSPQRVVYDLNPRAEWSDGTAITGADLVYTWQAQSGERRFADVGGKPFTPASTAAYSRVASVTTSASAPDQVTVTFKQPDADWESLFDPILPAHVAQRVGFDRGFTDPVADLPSGGPFMVQSYDPGRSLVLVRNPMWWGPAANLESVTISFVGSASDALPSLELGQLDGAVTPLEAGSLVPRPGLSVRVGASATYDDLIANERTGPLRRPALRQAVFLAVDRDAIAAAAVAAGDKGAQPVGNRALLPDQPGYRNDVGFLGPARGDVAKAKAVLRAAGYHLSHGVLTRQGRAVALTLGLATDTSLAAADTDAIRRACAALGIRLTVLTTTPAQETARVASGTYDLAVMAATVSPWPADLTAVYRTGARANVTGFSGPTMDGLLARARTTAPGPAGEAAVVAVDRLAWRDAIDLPLVAQPEELTCQGRYANLSLAPWGVGAEMAAWGIELRT